MAKDIEDYKKDFTDCIVNFCKRYTEADENHFKDIALAEYEANIENIEIKDINFNNGAEDADECMSYWDC